MLGPWNPAVRLLVSRLRVPVLAAAVVLVRTTPPPRATQPWSVPSSKSLETRGCASARPTPASVAATATIAPASGRKRQQPLPRRCGTPALDECARESVMGTSDRVVSARDKLDGSILI